MCRRKDVALGAMLQHCASCAWRCAIDSSKCKRKDLQMAAGKCCFIHSTEQSNPYVPLLASEGNFAVEVCDLPPGVNKLNVDHRVKVNPVKTTTNQAAETKSMSSMVRSFNLSDFFLIVLCVEFLPAGGSYTSITKFPQIQRSDSIQSYPSVL